MFFLGHRINGLGVHTTQEKVKAIVNAQASTCRQALQSFLGIFAFYDRFLKDRVSISCCLYKLPQKNTMYQEAFEQLKNVLPRQTLLAHYERKELLISCDVSPYGAGAGLISQRDDDGKEAPIAFAA